MKASLLLASLLTLGFSVTGCTNDDYDFDQIDATMGSVSYTHLSMGLNAVFAFTLCQAMGFTWQQALAVLLVEGIIFRAITFPNILSRILRKVMARKMIPSTSNTAKACCQVKPIADVYTRQLHRAECPGIHI